MVHHRLSLLSLPVVLTGLLLTPGTSGAQVRTAILGFGSRPLIYNPYLFTGAPLSYGGGTYPWNYGSGLTTYPWNSGYGAAPYSVPLGYGLGTYGWNYGYTATPYSMPWTGIRSAAQAGSYSYGTTTQYAPIYASASAGSDMAVHLEIHVPTANARLWVEGVELPNKGTVRRFVSPRLQPDGKYGYKIKAQWRENGKPITQTRDLVVRAGERLRVNFPERK